MSNTDTIIILNEARILNKVQNPAFGKMVAEKWKKRLDPYTPRDTGKLMDLHNEGNVEIYPFEIHYNQPYAKYVYYGYHLNFQKKNPFSTHTWDIAAAQAGQLNLLYTDINNALTSGRW